MARSQKKMWLWICFSGWIIIPVVDDAYCGNGIEAQMGPHQQRLRVGVANASNAGLAVKLPQIMLKLGAEGGIFNVMDLAVEPLLVRRAAVSPLSPSPITSWGMRMLTSWARGKF